jgi:hypothetical protein
MSDEKNRPELHYFMEQQRLNDSATELRSVWVLPEENNEPVHCEQVIEEVL